MDIIEEMKGLVKEVITEARKKKNDDARRSVKPNGFTYAESFDFSDPLGSLNRLRAQGVANFGPYTGVGPENALRVLAREAVQLAVKSDSSWDALSEIYERPVSNPWQMAEAIVKKGSKK